MNNPGDPASTSWSLDLAEPPCRALDVLKLLREKNPSAQIMALAVLPRGWTDAWHVYDWPSMYKPGIDAINRALKDYATGDDAVHYLDCGPAVTPDGKVGTPPEGIMQTWWPYCSAPSFYMVPAHTVQRPCI